MRNRVFRSVFICVCLVLTTFALQPTALSDENDVKAFYTKTEQQITMRDGVKLFTAIYTPKDQSQKYPIMLTRTPYSVSPYGPNAYRAALGPSNFFQQEKFIFVYQDVRGKLMSEGEFVDVRPYQPKKAGPKDIDESTDTYDTIDWLVKNVPNNNGRVGMWGISYPGFYTSMGVIDAHPALKAASPQAPIADWFIGDDFHHNGTLFLPHSFNFFSSFGLPRSGPTKEGPTRKFTHGTPDGYRFFLDLGPLSNANSKWLKGEIAFWNDMMSHPNYDDFWQARNIRPHLRNIKPAVMTVGGWFDAEDLFGALNTYKTIEATNPGARNALVMGPWFHGGWSRSDGDALGSVSFGQKTGPTYRETVEFPFFNCLLKDKCDRKLAEAIVFETGSNKWREYDSWPPKNAETRQIFFNANGGLSFTAPSGGAGYDEYVSDPAHPVPYINNIAIGMTREYMVDDQRFAATRPDVLVYQTDVLDRDVTLAGPIKATLFVSTSGTDSDFVVKLIDVFPNSAPETMAGYEMLVRGEPMRARFRNSFSKPEAMAPGKVTKIEFTLPDVNHSFQRGHRIMVQVQSTWFPLVDRNPQKFVDIYRATEADFQKATQRVYRAGANASRLTVNVLK
jgi:putative CocE/NonD family hydrolase